MLRREALFAVVGGVVGAVLVMAAGSFSPLGAQNESVNLREITCTGLRVVDEDGAIVGLMSGDEHGGRVSVYGKDGEAKVKLSVYEGYGHVGVGTRVYLIAGEDNGYVHVLGNGGKVTISVDENGGNVDVFFKDSRLIPEARLSADENGGFVHVTGFPDGNSAAVTLSPTGVVMR